MYIIEKANVDKIVNHSRAKEELDLEKRLVRTPSTPTLLGASASQNSLSSALGLSCQHLSYYPTKGH